MAQSAASSSPGAAASSSASGGQARVLSHAVSVAAVRDDGDPDEVHAHGEEQKPQAGVESFPLPLPADDVDDDGGKGDENKTRL